MIEIRNFFGPQIAPHLDATVALRLAIFREWPYLLAGDPDQETHGLAACAASPDSLFVLAFDGDRLVGASTGVPLAGEAASVQRPFHDRGIAIGDVFHLGESALLDEYRGRGLGHRFFDEREAHARRLGRFVMTAFCAMERSEDDPRRPPRHRGNELFWTKRGYRRQHDMVCEVDWTELGQVTPTRQRLGVWLRPLEHP